MPLSDNELLRDHVTKTQFVLTLSKTHIAALVELDHQLKDNIYYHIEADSPFGRVVRGFVSPGVRGLMVRGLVEHTPPLEKDRRGKRVPTKQRRIWKITKAGRAVITLLKEAGIWQEYDALWEQSSPKAMEDF